MWFVWTVNVYIYQYQSMFVYGWYKTVGTVYTSFLNITSCWTVKPAALLLLLTMCIWYFSTCSNSKWWQVICLKCFDAVGWVAGSASGLFLADCTNQSCLWHNVSSVCLWRFVLWQNGTSEGVNRKPGSKSWFFVSPPYFYFRFHLYGHQDGRFCLKGK